MQNLHQYISQHMALTQEDLVLLDRFFLQKVIKPRTFLLKEGQVEHYLYFIKKGVIKAFRNIEGKYVVEHLTGNGRFFTSIESFIKASPSLENVQTITTCEVVKISKPDFDLLINTDSKWQHFFNQLSNETLLCKMERINDFQTLTARQRYEKFIRQRPDVVLAVPVEALSSYLGIEPQSLSRIRKQLIL